MSTCMLAMPKIRSLTVGLLIAALAWSVNALAREPGRGDVARLATSARDEADLDQAWLRQALDSSIVVAEPGSALQKALGDPPAYCSMSFMEDGQCICCAALEGDDARGSTCRAIDVRYCLHVPPTCVPIPLTKLGETRVTFMPFKAAEVVAKLTGMFNGVSWRFGPLTCNPYNTTRAGGKFEDYMIGCCDDPWGMPAIYHPQRVSGFMQYEQGISCSGAIGAALVFSMFPQTMPLVPMGHQIDDLARRFGGGCDVRAFIEGGGGGTYSNWEPKAPCQDCNYDFSIGGYALGGAGVGCSIARFNGISPATVSLQGWIKATLNYTQDCKESHLKFDAARCIQYRVRMFDFIDVEDQSCTSFFGDPIVLL